MKKSRRSSKYRVEENVPVIDNDSSWLDDIDDEACDEDEVDEINDKADNNPIDDKGVNANNKACKQKHTHEFLGSTKIDKKKHSSHNHRFAGITGEAIIRGNSHIHNICTNTDYFDHYHGIKITSGPAIFVGSGRHIHFVIGNTTLEDGHQHKFILATLIDKSISN